MPIMIDGQIYATDPDNIERELALALALGKTVKTSRPAPGQFSEIYATLASRGFDGIVSVHLSGELSGTCEAARLAAASASIPVEIIDTRTAGLAQGFLVMDTVEYLANYDDAAPESDNPTNTPLAQGSGQFVAKESVNSSNAAFETEPATVNETLRRPEKVTEPVQGAFAKVRNLVESVNPSIDFAVPSLEQLRAGGRISLTASVFGSLLSVKPILNIVDGKLQVRERVRTTPKVFARLLELTVQEAESRGVPCRFGVQSFGNEEIARQLARDLESFTNDPIVITTVPTVLAAHTGAGVLAICCAPTR
jgi:fatty acid-binding protein DegV